MVEVYVLSGFLGAGKTSVLQHLIASAGPDEDMVLIVNEFGKLGLDGKLVEGKGYNTVELLSGCICCTLNDDLQEALDGIVSEFKPAKIVIEASGIANPHNIRRAADSARLRGRLDVRCVATVLDLRMWKRRKALGKIYHEQLAEADLIVLNKCDLAVGEELACVTAEVEASYPSAATVRATHGCFPLERLWREGAGGGLPHLSRFENSGVTPDYCSVNYQSDRPMRREELLAYLAALPEGVLRVKGQACYADGSRELVDRVGADLSLRPGLEHIDATLLVFIGEGLDAERLKTDLDALRV